METAAEKKYECKHVVYCNKKDNTDYDLHVLKIIEHNPDGTTVPKLKFIKNFEKKFWVTNRENRYYKDKREKMPLNCLNEYKSTRYELLENIAKALDIKWRGGDPRQIFNSPYLFGNDISTESTIKHHYMEKYKKFSYSSVAVFDIETSVLSGNEEIIMATLSFKDKVHTVILNDYVKNFHNVENTLQEKFEFYLGEYKKKRNINWTMSFHDTPGKMIVNLFKKAHEWKPDFISIWNINFDIPKVLDALKKENIDPAEVFSDPSVPKPFKFFEYVVGQKSRTTASGVFKNFKDAEQWHYVLCPSSFVFTDAMQVYYALRVAKQKESSYKLDYILDKELGIRKLKFKESDHIPSSSIEWHKFMQQNYKLEYIIYNTFDCISCEELDEKTLDICLSLAQGINCSEYKNFCSQPRRVMDILHWSLLESGYVSGCSGNVVNKELDNLVVPFSGWIVTLPAHLIKKSEFNFFKETDALTHSIHVDVADADISASYPNGISVFNISKDTTVNEIHSVGNLDYDHTVRPASINLSGGETNSVEWVTNLCSAPTLLKLDDAFQKYLNEKDDKLEY